MPPRGMPTTRSAGKEVEGEEEAGGYEGRNLLWATGDDEDADECRALVCCWGGDDEYGGSDDDKVLVGSEMEPR